MYTEGERNLRYLQTYGKYPAIPKQLLGNNISTIVGDWYRGERQPRKLQRFPFLEEQELGLARRHAPTSYPPLSGVSNTENWLLIGGLALFFLFGLVSFK